MKKIVLYTILSVSLVISSANVIAEMITDNYIVNTGAEESTLFWATFGGGPDLLQSSAQSHTGSYSFLSAGRTAFYHGPVTSIKALVDDAQLLTGQRYSASVWVYHNEATAKKIQLNIKQVDANGTQYRKLEDELVPPNQWVELVQHFVLEIDNSLESLDLYVITPSGETFDFYSDDFFLGELENYTPPASSDPSDFIRASGDRLVVGAADELIVLRGVNVSIPSDSDDDSDDIWDVKSVSLKDFKNIKSIGFNAIRLHMNYKLFEDDSDIGQFKEDGWHWLDRAITFAKQANIYLLLDMHTPQGGYQSDKSIGFSAFWDGSGSAPNTSNQDRLLTLWQAIAGRYKDEPAILGFDLINEPRPNSSEEWFTYAEQLIAGIRSTDDNHLIVLEVPFIPGFVMRTVADSNVLYDAHTYSIWGYATQYSVHYGKDGQRWGKYSDTNPLYIDAHWDVAWTPEEGGTPPANSSPFNKAWLENMYVDEILEFTNSNSVPVDIGEYGSVIETFSNDVGAIDMIQDTHRIFEGDNRYGTKINRFYFNYHGGVFGLYGNWNGFQVDEANVNSDLKPEFSFSDDDSGGDTGDDKTAPIIHLLGDLIVTITQGESYLDAGVTAADDVDGDISSDVTVRGNVNINETGQYKLYFNVSDSSGNHAIEQYRTVIVVASNDDNTAQTDLHLSFSWEHYPKVPEVGRAHKFAAKISNISSIAAQETELKIELPERAVFHKGRNCQVSDDGYYILCNMGKIPANQSRKKIIYLKLYEGSAVTVNAEVASSIEDKNTDNNEAMATLTISEDVDLSVKISKKGRASVGEALRVKLITKNKGPAVAQGIETVFPIPEDAEFVSASSACRYIADWDEVFCNWDSLKKNAKRTVYIYIRPLEKIRMTIEANTTAENNDLNDANNLIERSFKVR